MSSALLKFTYIIVLLLSQISLQAKIRNFETTHLKSTAGAGVGSILLEESSILNPAPIAFFKTSSMYLQKTGTQFNNKDIKNPYSDPESEIMAVIVSDTKGKAKGSVSYVNQEEGYSKRKRVSASLSYLIGPKSAMGLSYSYSMDLMATKSKIEPMDKYQQITAGFTHIINESTTVGIVFIDPMQTKPEDTKAIIGFQYNLKDYVSLMADAGADYNQDLSNTFLYRVAIQVKMLDSFFLRVGKFEDKGLLETGNGAGLSWIGPKLMAEIAVKNSKSTHDKIDSRKIKESSFSLSYRF